MNTGYEELTGVEIDFDDSGYLTDSATGLQLSGPISTWTFDLGPLELRAFRLTDEALPLFADGFETGAGPVVRPPTLKTTRSPISDFEFTAHLSRSTSGGDGKLETENQELKTCDG